MGTETEQAYIILILAELHTSVIFPGHYRLNSVILKGLNVVNKENGILVAHSLQHIVI